MEDSILPKRSQLLLHGSYTLAPNHYLKVHMKRSTVSFYCIFADGPVLVLLREQQGVPVQVFLHLASTLMESGGNVATLHVGLACGTLNITANALYVAIYKLRKGGLIQRWKAQKYVLNPYCVWAYDQRHLLLARQVWDTWDTLSLDHICEVMTLISTRIR